MDTTYQSYHEYWRGKGWIHAHCKGRAARPKDCKGKLTVLTYVRVLHHKDKCFVCGKSQEQLLLCS